MSVKTDIRNAIISCTKEITTPGGYNFTYKHIYDPPRNMDQMVEYPSVNVMYGQENRLGERHTVNNNSLYDIMLPVQFDVFLHSTQNTSLAQDKALADFQRYYGNNYYLKPTSGNRTVFEIRWLNDVPWGTELEVPNCGISIDFEIYYSIRVNNPDQMI